MSLPVRPPTLPNALVTPDPTLERVPLVELLTLLRPSEALDTDVEAVSLALEAVSAVVEACLILFRRRRNRDWRMAALDAGADTMAKKTACVHRGTVVEAM